MRDQIFISYSRENKKWLQMLELYLKPLIATHKIKVWSDAEIQPGKEWEREIADALESARVAVLLVSPEFLGSEFITKVELPALLEASNKGEVQILWVAVSQSAFKFTEIVRFQAANDPKEPLDGLKKAERGEAMVEIVEKIKEAYGKIEPDIIDTPEEPRRPSSNGRLVVLLYKRNAKPDENVLELIAAGLREHGYRVFIDKHLRPGVRWAQEIAQNVRSAYAVIPLVSAASSVSEMFAFEIETASDAAEKQDGIPVIIPVRVKFEGPLLDETLSSILDQINYISWRGPQDDSVLLSSLLNSLNSPPEPKSDVNLPPIKAAGGPLEPPWGAVPLKSKFYIERSTDGVFHTALTDNVGIVLVKGARQMGKTSLLARGLQQMRAAGVAVVMTDLQALNGARMETAEALYLTLGQMIAKQLELTDKLSDVWDSDDSPNFNFQNYLRRYVLPSVSRLVWALDEVDRLFTYDYQNDVFGLSRSIFNLRGLDPEGGWEKLTQIIVYATEAHLFITDPHMSPFNVGDEPIKMADFSNEQVTQVNSRFDPPAPLADSEIPDFCDLVGGHPYLVRRGLYEMKKRGLRFSELKSRASTDEGPYGDHLRRILSMLARDRDLRDEVRHIIGGGKSTDEAKFYRLRSAGLVTGEAPQDARIRCEVYRDYLQRRLFENH